MAINPESRNLARGTGIVAGLTFLSRIFGLIRDLLVARLFGASIVADCFFVAFKIPNLLRSFVAEGALSAAFVPLFSGELRNGKEKAQQVISLVIGFLGLVTLFLTLLGIIFTPEILSLIAPGLMQGTHALLCVELTRIMLPYIICVSFVAMLNGALNSVNIFGAAAMAQVLMNLVLISGALLAENFAELTAVKILAYSVIAGGLLQVIVQIPPLAKAGFAFIPRFKLFSPQIRELVRLMIPAILGATVYQITQFLNILFATMLVSGSVSWLFYADRVTQLPVGVFSIALASVLLPTLSRASAEKDARGFTEQLINSLRYTSFFIIPLAAVIFLYAEDVVSIIYQRGEFEARDTINTATAVRAYAVGIWAVSCHSMLARAFIAKKDTLTPTLIGAATLCVTVVLSLLLMGPLSAGSSRAGLFLSGWQTELSRVLPALNLGHAGLALASSLSAYFSFGMLIIIQGAKSKDLSWKEFLMSTFKSAAASAVALCAAASIPALSSFRVVNLVGEICLATFLFFLLTYLFKTRESSEIIKVLKERIGRFKS